MNYNRNCKSNIVYSYQIQINLLFPRYQFGWIVMKADSSIQIVLQNH